MNISLNGMRQLQSFELGTEEKKANPRRRPKPNTHRALWLNYSWWCHYVAHAVGCWPCHCVGHNDDDDDPSLYNPEAIEQAGQTWFNCQSMAWDGDGEYPNKNHEEGEETEFNQSLCPGSWTWARLGEDGFTSAHICCPKSTEKKQLRG